MKIKKVRIRIGGMDYLLTTDGDVNYLRDLGDEVDDAISSVKKEHFRLSTTQAAVLSALQFADEKHKAVKKAASLRKDIQGYMEDASKAKTDAEIAKREVDRLTKEIANLKNELSRCKNE